MDRLQTASGDKVQHELEIKALENGGYDLLLDGALLCCSAEPGPQLNLNLDSPTLAVTLFVRLKRES